MKKLTRLFLIFLLFPTGSISLIAQDNLKFSKALFIEMNSDKLKEFVAIDTTITVPEGKVWKITSTKTFMRNKDYVIYENEAQLYINQQPIDYYKSPLGGEIWLPSGSYRFRIMSKLRSKNIYFHSFISGIEYEIY